MLIWLLWGFACVYQLCTYALVKRFKTYEVDPEPQHRPSYPVSHLKTISGRQERTESCLRSYLEQNYAGEQEVVFSAGRLNDPATPVARKIAESFNESATSKGNLPRLGSKIQVKVIEGDASGLATNPKVASMIQAYPHCTLPFVLSTDSDMNAPPGYMNKIMEHFEDPQVGMVTSLYCIQRVHKPAMALEAMSVLDFSTSVLVARALEGMSFGLGANMAFRREALEQVGAFDAMGDYLAEDYQLGNRITKNGWKVKLAGTVVEDVLPTMRFKDYFSHQLRWMRTYRISRPAGHCAFVVTQGLLWALLLLLIYGLNPLTGLAALAWWMIRGRCTAENWKALGGQEVERWIVFLPFKDLVYLILWFLSLGGDTVKWGKRELQLFPDGRMRLIRMLE